MNYLAKSVYKTVHLIYFPHVYLLAKNVLFSVDFARFRTKKAPSKLYTYECQVIAVIMIINGG